MELRPAVSTHSRLKAAGFGFFGTFGAVEQAVSTHSRLKAAGHQTRQHRRAYPVSTHSRLKAAGPMRHRRTMHRLVSTHSRLKAAGTAQHLQRAVVCRFNTQPPEGGWTRHPPCPHASTGFNTQPPEGGWPRRTEDIRSRDKFQHTAA